MSRSPGSDFHCETGKWPVAKVKLGNFKYYVTPCLLARWLCHSRCEGANGADRVGIVYRYNLALV